MVSTLADGLLAWAWYQTVLVIVLIIVIVFYVIWKKKQT